MHNLCHVPSINDSDNHCHSIFILSMFTKNMHDLVVISLVSASQESIITASKSNIVGNYSYLKLLI